MNIVFLLLYSDSIWNILSTYVLLDLVIFHFAEVTQTNFLAESKTSVVTTISSALSEIFPTLPIPVSVPRALLWYTVEISTGIAFTSLLYWRVTTIGNPLHNSPRLAKAIACTLLKGFLCQKKSSISTTHLSLVNSTTNGEMDAVYGAKIPIKPEKKYLPTSKS